MVESLKNVKKLILVLLASMLLNLALTISMAGIIFHWQDRGYVRPTCGQTIERYHQCLKDIHSGEQEEYTLTISGPTIKVVDQTHQIGQRGPTVTNNQQQQQQEQEQQERSIPQWKPVGMKVLPSPKPVMPKIPTMRPQANGHQDVVTLQHDQGKVEVVKIEENETSVQGQLEKSMPVYGHGGHGNHS